MSSNRNQLRSQREKNGEYYTYRKDIDNELMHYPNAFKGKVVYCNCDDPRESEFFRFFSENFETLGLKKLLASCYKAPGGDLFSEHLPKNENKSCWLEYNGDKNGDRKVSLEEIDITKWDSDGDFRKSDSIALLKQSDIVVTNPPFSLSQEHMKQAMEYKKDFIVIGNWRAVGYKDIWSNIQDGNIRIGASKRSMKFWTYERGKKVEKSVNAAWFTNLAHTGKQRITYPTKLYDSSFYRRYDNFDAIESYVNDIPIDYDGMIGVPTTYLEKHNSEMFQVLGTMRQLIGGSFYIDGEEMDMRFIIQRRHPVTAEELSYAKWKRENPKPEPTSKEKCKKELIKKHGRKCFICGDEKTNNTDIHFDHHYPESLGGETSIRNGGLLCAGCNIRKGDRIESEGIPISYADLRDEFRAKGLIA